MSTRKLSAAERQRLYAPKVSAALNRESAFTQEAASALDQARAFVARVNELQLEEGAIVDMLAEAFFCGTLHERRELPKREARAASAALGGAKALLTNLAGKLQALADEHDRKADQS